MHETTLLSIVIATYQAETTLAKTLQSLIDNSEINFELIIVDAGSTDGTISIIQQYEPHLKWWKSETDKGIYDAWNKALAKITTPWVSFLGAGDEYIKGALTAYAAAAIQNPSVDFISGNQIQTTLQDKIIRQQGVAWEWKVFRHRMTVTHVGNWHSMNTFKQVGFFDIHFKITGDYEWLLRKGPSLKAVYINQTLVKMLAGGISDRGFKVVYETAEAKRKWSQLHPVIINIDIIYALLRKVVGRILYSKN